MEVKFFDRYTWHARTLPVYFTSVSAILAIAAALPEGLNLPLASASGVVFVPLSYFFSQVGSDFGKHLEPSLWRSWGGPPTTRYLRHTNDEFNAATRERVHTRLREIGLEIPTAAEEESDPDRGVGARMRAGLRASNRRARHLPMRYETGLPSSVIRFRT